MLGVNNPSGLAVDWISKNIFISTNEEEARIVACNLKGEFFTVIYSSDKSILNERVSTPETEGLRDRVK